MRFAKIAHNTLQSPLAIHSPETPFFHNHSTSIPLPLSSSNRMVLGHSNLDKLFSTLYFTLPSSSSYATLIFFSGRITYSGTACTPFFTHFHPAQPSGSSRAYPCSGGGL